ncbi:MAG: DUF4136 domain-containing protein [Phycisphaeraceae bacterium]|nr:DUF4136 domain-containing protein [Phycisphaeraceae bacterium]
MKTNVKVALIFTLLSVAGCGSPVRVDFDTDTDFSSFRTYRWFDGEIHHLDALASNPLAKKRVVRAVDIVLQEKGFVVKEGSACDFTVFVHGTVQQRVQIHDTGGMYGHYGRFGMGVSHIDLSTYDEGVLLVDVIDGSTQALVWRGSLSRKVTYHKDPNKAEAAIEKTVRKILEEFPPLLAE